MVFQDYNTFLKRKMHSIKWITNIACMTLHKCGKALATTLYEWRHSITPSLPLYIYNRIMINTSQLQSLTKVIPNLCYYLDGYLKSLSSCKIETKWFSEYCISCHMACFVLVMIFLMTFFMNKFTSILPSQLSFTLSTFGVLCTLILMSSNIVMKDWNLDEKSLNKWQ